MNSKKSSGGCRGRSGSAGVRCPFGAVNVSLPAKTVAGGQLSVISDQEEWLHLITDNRSLRASSSVG